MSLSWDDNLRITPSPHSKKKQVADIPALNSWLYALLWARLFAAGISPGSNSTGRAHPPKLSWEPCFNIYSFWAQHQVLIEQAQLMGFLDAVGCLRKIKRMAGKEGKVQHSRQPITEIIFHADFPQPLLHGRGGEARTHKQRVIV